MTTNIEKRIYNTPLLTKIELDNEISLVLLSGDDNPDEPTTGQNFKTPEYLKNDPFSNKA